MQNIIPQNLKKSKKIYFVMGVWEMGSEKMEEGGGNKREKRKD